MRVYHPEGEHKEAYQLLYTILESGGGLDDLLVEELTKVIPIIPPIMEGIIGKLPMKIVKRAQEISQTVSETNWIPLIELLGDLMGLNPFREFVKNVAEKGHAIIP